MFPVCEAQQYSTNVIAQGIYDSTDEVGHRYQLLDEIICHWKLSSTISKSNGYVISIRMGRGSGWRPPKDGRYMSNGGMGSARGSQWLT